MRKTSKKAAKKETFENRTRFNWGYHDAAQTVRMGWDCDEHNWGFARGGDLGAIRSVRDVLARHFDKAYAQGWQAGYHDAKDGFYENDSGPAWERAKFAGLVTE